jgi:peptidyl-tRNA hydrolase
VVIVAEEFILEKIRLRSVTMWTQLIATAGQTGIEAGRVVNIYKAI